MSNPIRLVVPGDPKALKRHRTYIGQTKDGRTFRSNVDPSREQKADFLQMVRDRAPIVPFWGPVALVIFFFFTRPKNHYGTGKNAAKLKTSAPVWHYSNPDTTNLVKFIEDAFNTVFFRDDRQICKLTVVKMYGEKPRTEIVIEELGD